jgi:quercetin dioxygenase-like cupin family protein
MTTRDHELAADVVLGSLDVIAMQKARIRMVEDREFAALVEAWERRLAPLLPAGAEPPPAAILERAEKAIENAGEFLPGTVTRRAGSGDWIAMAPGLRIKVLNVIAALNRQTILVELAPGGEYRSHEHSQDEEIYMISGDLEIGGLELGPGDFHIARAGRTHPVHRTRAGCICIISQAIDE